MPGSQGEGSATQKKGYGKDTLRPVTIKQLHDAVHPHPDADHFIIDNSEATQVTFIGQVRNISTQTTNVTYKLDDGTGIIEVKQWIDAEAMQDPDDPSNQKAKPVEEGYARVWGRLKAFNNKRHVGANYIRPIQDFNEIQYHLLEATAVHLHFAKGPVENLQQGQAQGGTNGMANGHQQSNGYAQPDTGMSGVSQSARKVFSILKQTPQGNEGLHAQDIAIRAGLEMSEVLKAGDELLSTGKIYTTVDDATWALLEL